MARFLFWVTESETIRWRRYMRELWFGIVFEKSGNILELCLKKRSLNCLIKNLICVYFDFVFMSIIIKFLTTKFRIYREKHIITGGNILEIFGEVMEMMPFALKEEEENGSRRKTRVVRDEMSVFCVFGSQTWVTGCECWMKTRSRPLK